MMTQPGWFRKGIIKMPDHTRYTVRILVNSRWRLSDNAASLDDAKTKKAALEAKGWTAAVFDGPKQVRDQL